MFSCQARCVCVCVIQQDALQFCLWLLRADGGLQMFMERLKVCSNGFASGTDLAGRFMVRTAQSDIASSALRTVSAQRLALHPAFKCAHKQLGCVMSLLQLCGYRLCNCQCQCVAKRALPASVAAAQQAQVLFIANQIVKHANTLQHALHASCRSRSCGRTTPKASRAPRSKCQTS